MFPSLYKYIKVIVNTIYLPSNIFNTVTYGLRVLEKVVNIHTYL